MIINAPGVKGETHPMVLTVDELVETLMRLWLGIRGARIEPELLVAEAFIAACTVGLGRQARLDVDNSPHDQCRVSWVRKQTVLDLWRDGDPQADLRLYWRLRGGAPPNVLVYGLASDEKEPHVGPPGATATSGRA